MTKMILSMALIFGFTATSHAQFGPPRLSPSPLGAAFGGAPGFSNHGCNPQFDPHTFECHTLAFNGQSEFPLVELNTVQGEWFAVTYAIRGSNSGAGFFMDKNQFRPSQPGRGVFNLTTHGQVGSIVGNLFISGNRATFQNWQGSVMTSTPGTFVFLDSATIQFNAIDHLGIQHAFQCRDFIRRGNHHLTCRWLVLRQGQWDFVGYFGFLQAHVWEQFAAGRAGRGRH